MHCARVNVSETRKKHETLSTSVSLLYIEAGVQCGIHVFKKNSTLLASSERARARERERNGGEG